MLNLSVIRHLIRNPNISRTVASSSAKLPNIQTEEVVVESRDITKDRTEEIPLETSIRYLASAAYKQTYGEQPVWVGILSVEVL